MDNVPGPWPAAAMLNVPGLWLVASLFGAVGVAMQLRWLLTRTEASGARTKGMVKAAIVEGIGLILLFLSARDQAMVYGLIIVFGLGGLIGFVASRALRPPL